jgi:hypothetical protein
MSFLCQLNEEYGIQLKLTLTNFDEPNQHPFNLELPAPTSMHNPACHQWHPTPTIA